MWKPFSTYAFPLSPTVCLSSSQCCIHNSLISPILFFLFLLACTIHHYGAFCCSAESIMRSKTFKQVEHNKEAGRSHAGKYFPMCRAFPLERIKLFCVDCRSARGEVDIFISHKDNFIMCLKFVLSLSSSSRTLHACLGTTVLSSSPLHTLLGRKKDTIYKLPPSSW